MASRFKCHNCPLCSFRTILTFRIRYHMMTHDLPQKEKLFNCANTINPLKCFPCVNFQTHNVAHLRLHVKAGHTPAKFKERLYECESCTFQTYSKYLSLRHDFHNLCVGSFRLEPEETKRTRVFNLRDKDRSKDELEYFVCDYCAYKVPSMSVLNDHVRIMHEKHKLYKCQHCLYKTKKNTNLKCHIAIRHTDPDKIEWFKCDHCSYKSKTKSNLKNHTDWKHANKESLKCADCPFKTPSKLRMKNHTKLKHTKIQWLHCDQCSYKSKLKFHLRRHIGYEHGNGTKFKCDHCRFQTRSKEDLGVHVSAKHTHPDTKQWFQCAQCSHKSKSNSNLTTHVEHKHGGDEDLKCDHCPFETKFKHVIQRHVLKEHADPDSIEWFDCAQCAFRSKTRSYLKHHIDDKHGQIEPRKCEHCPFESKYGHCMKDHVLLKHTAPEKIRWFECEHCSYRSPIKGYVRKHASRHRGAADRQENL